MKKSLLTELYGEKFVKKVKAKIEIQRQIESDLQREFTLCDKDCTNCIGCLYEDIARYIVQNYTPIDNFPKM